jgi:hypothetical protein
MLRKIHYFGERRIREREKEGKETRQYRRRKVNGASAKERKKNNVKALLRKAFLASVSCLL